MPTCLIKKKKFSDCPVSIARFIKLPYWLIFSLISNIFVVSFLIISPCVWLRIAVCKTVYPCIFFLRALTFNSKSRFTKCTSLRRTAISSGYSPSFVTCSRLMPICEINTSKTSISEFSMAIWRSAFPLFGSTSLILKVYCCKMSANF